MTDRLLEERFRVLDGFSSRHSQSDREACAAAIALGRKDIDQYQRIQEHLRADHW